MEFRRSRSFQEDTGAWWQIAVRLIKAAAEIHFPWLWNLDIIAMGRQGIMSNVRQVAVAALGVGCFILAGCVETRDPKTVPIKQAQDQAMTCDDLGIEYRTNTSVAAHKIAKNNEDDGKDVALGLLIWPGLADFKNADGIEGNALLDRNIYLRELAMKKCEISEWPKQPERYD